MAKYKFSKRSLDRMQGVNPDLIKVLKEAIKNSPVDFGITEGVRTVTRQKELVKAGKSQTMKSRHLTGHAVDIVAYDKDGKVTWDFTVYEKIAGHILGIAAQLQIPMIWGGSWMTFKDGVHFELNKAFYP